MAAQVTGTPIALALGTSATPGAQAVTVPADAQGVVVFSRNYQARTLTLASTFAGTFSKTIPYGAEDSGFEITSVQVAPVTATGSQTITPTWSGAIGDGPLFFVAFVKGIDNSSFANWVRDSNAEANDVVASSFTLSVASIATDLVLALDSQYNSSNTLPGDESGWTNLQTLGVNGEAGKLRSCDAPGASTTGATTQGTQYRGISIVSIKSSASAINYSLTCDVGSYSFTGVAATLTGPVFGAFQSNAFQTDAFQADTPSGTAYSLTADAGSYALTGVAAGMRIGYSLVSDAGAYSLTGVAATLKRGYLLTADVGSYALTGVAATLTYTPGAVNYSLTGDAGAYSLSGQDASLVYSAGSAAYTLTADSGSYSLSGQAATFSFARNLPAAAGAYSLSGVAATFTIGRQITADAGAYALSGVDAGLVYTTTGPTAYTLTCDAGAYALAGVDAGLVYSGAVPASGGHGFVLIDAESKLWWKRKPKAIPEEEATAKVERVVRVIERVARQQVEAPKPFKAQKTEVREAIAPIVEQMPGFDWMAVYTAILDGLEKQRKEQQAQEAAAQEIARIQRIQADEDDVLALLMAVI